MTKQKHNGLTLNLLVAGLFDISTTQEARNI